MCPLCWATALISFGGIIAISVVSAAGNDKPTLTIAAALAFSFFFDRYGEFTLPWYPIAALIAMIVGRVIYLVVFRWQELLLFKAWIAARQIAARRCPKTYKLRSHREAILQPQRGGRQ